MMAGALTNAWKNAILSRAYGNSGTYTPPAYFVVGNGTGSPAAGDAYIPKPLPTSSTTIDACDATTGWTQGGDGSAAALDTTVGNFKEGTGCLDLTAVKSTGFADWSKTVGAVNLSGGQYFYCWFYVSAKATYIDSTGSYGVRLKLGTGGLTNSNNYDTTYANLTDGWNLLAFAAASYSSQNGAGATLSNVDTLDLQVDLLATAAGTNMRMDYWRYCALTAHQVAISGGYPQYNTGSRLVTVRGTVDVSQCNGDIINAAGLINADSPLLFLGWDNVSPSIPKTNKIRVSLTWKDNAL